MHHVSPHKDFGCSEWDSEFSEGCGCNTVSLRTRATPSVRALCLHTKVSGFGDLGFTV